MPVVTLPRANCPSAVLLMGRGSGSGVSVALCTFGRKAKQVSENMMMNGGIGIFIVGGSQECDQLVEIKSLPVHASEGAPGMLPIFCSGGRVACKTQRSQPARRPLQLKRKPWGICIK